MEPQRKQSIEERDFAKEVELMKVLVCPVCKDVPLPPIYKCTEGHIICYECLPNQQRCATCQNGFSNTRDYALEAIFTSSSFTCKFKDHGCDRILKGAALVIHLRKCEFRPVQCMYRNCNESVSAVSYMSHLKTVHQIKGHDTESESYEFKNANNFVQSEEEIDLGMEYAYFNGHYFLMHLVIRDKVAYQCISLVGPEAELKNYTATFSIASKTSEAPEIQWKIPVQSYRETPDWDICVAIPIRQLKFFMTSGTIGDAEGNQSYKFVWETKCRISKTL